MNAPLAGLMLATVAVMGCVAPATGAGGPSGTPASAPLGAATIDPEAAGPATYATGTPMRQLDPTVEPVSRSKPSQEAAAVMDACWAGWFGVDSISGMGKIDHASDVAHYVPLMGPELKSADAAWVVTYSGKLDLPRGLGWAVNPVCVFLDGDPILYTPEEYGQGDRSVQPAMPATPPSLMLPPLAP